MWGYCVFQYDPLTQGMIENDTFVLRDYAEGVDPYHPDSEKIIWYVDPGVEETSSGLVWSGVTFTQTPPN